eukprot:1196326-Prorocentrum_minimum.AAC.4
MDPLAPVQVWSLSVGLGVGVIVPDVHILPWPHLWVAQEPRPYTVPHMAPHIPNQLPPFPRGFHFNLPLVQPQGQGTPNEAIGKCKARFSLPDALFEGAVTKLKPYLHAVQVNASRVSTRGVQIDGVVVIVLNESYIRTHHQTACKENQHKALASAHDNASGEFIVRGRVFKVSILSVHKNVKLDLILRYVAMTIIAKKRVEIMH